MKQSPKRYFSALAMFAGWSGLLLLGSGCRSTRENTELQAGGLRFETVRLTNQSPAITLQLTYRPGLPGQRPAILMLGGFKRGEPPAWSTNLLAEGYLLAAFNAEHPPDPDPARRPQWLHFDQRFAHSYVLGGARAPKDAGRVIDYLVRRGDVNPRKLGWLGSSSTGILGLSVAVNEPRLAAFVGFVSTGAYRHWLATWRTNGLWKGATNGLWSETEALLERADPILRADKLFPCAVLLVSGGEDKVVDPASARVFVRAARPYYASDPDRLRLVVYEGAGHNLPADVVAAYAEHWFRLYLHPAKDPPAPRKPPASLDESTRQTQMNRGEHRDVIQAK